MSPYVIRQFSKASYSHKNLFSEYFKIDNTYCRFVITENSENLLIMNEIY